MADTYPILAPRVSANGSGLAEYSVQGAINQLAGDVRHAINETVAGGPTSGVATYTGWYTNPRPATDARPLLQAALDASSTIHGTGYYNYLTRTTQTLKLAPGQYYLSCPAAGPSLSVPTGVTLDASDATLFFDYPTGLRYDWSAIQLNQYSNLWAGKIYPSGNNTVPTSDLIYDAVRIVFTDNNTRVIGGKDSEIAGFTGGSAVRGLGAWITFVENIRLASCAYGYVASNWGTQWGTVYPLPAGNPSGASRRVHTDLRMNRVQMVNISNGGIVGAAQGNIGTSVNALDFADTGLTLDLSDCILESIGAYAISAGNVLNLSMKNCALEEVGSGDGMVSFNTVRNVCINQLRVNLAGRSVPGPSGPVTPFPSTIFKNASVQCFTLDEMYLHNSFNAGLAFANASAAKSYSVSNIFADSHPLPAGAMYGGPGVLSLNGGVAAVSTSGSGAPANTPVAVGLLYVDTTNKKIYSSTGTSSSADWTILN